MNKRDFFFHQLKHGHYSIKDDVLIVDDVPGDQMARVDEATLREVIAEAPKRPRIEGQVAPAPWPNTDPTLAVFHVSKENKPHAAKTR